ncbi:PhoH family protein [Marinilongibacter aquaticus]|uniref:PhoH family protein n=1 Tax=Marinilongibacter aquaticus TaxID=2975157 RepID=UPI0021BD9F3F|nr:PhoH family protein [Marinilongibacter aquaticus]UBM59560.1 PhoH family protein [Marinilongibacter aquaticus]
MTEKVILLQGVSLIDFLGIQNANIKEIGKAYPSSRLVSRGEEILIKGPAKDIRELGVLFENLLDHYHRFGKLTLDNVKDYLQNENAQIPSHILSDEVLVHGNKGMLIKAKTANQKKLVEASFQNDIVFAIGPAGTGKTYTAVALAVKALKEKQVKKIIITRPAVEAGENLGFLPGDLKEKIDPYLRPIYDALNDMLPSERYASYVEKNTIEIAPLAYMRGRTLNNAFIILDEAQNTTPMQLKMFLTRMGPNSKTIITGDTTQVDLPKKQKSGLEDAVHKLNKIDGIKFIELDGKDVVRHPLVVKILEAYEKADS